MILLVLVVLSLWATPCAASGAIFLYDTGIKEDRSQRYSISEAQRCYSFSCWATKVSYVSYQRTSKHAWMVLYDRPRCQGNTIKMFGSNGAARMTGSTFDNKIGSAMVWESSKYPTRGFVDRCPEERAEGISNGSLIGAGSGSAYNNTNVGDSDDATITV